VLHDVYSYATRIAHSFAQAAFATQAAIAHAHSTCHSHHHRLNHGCSKHQWSRCVLQCSELGGFGVIHRQAAQSQTKACTRVVCQVRFVDRTVFLLACLPTLKLDLQLLLSRTGLIAAAQSSGNGSSGSGGGVPPGRNVRWIYFSDLETMYFLAKQTIPKYLAVTAAAAALKAVSAPPATAAAAAGASLTPTAPAASQLQHHPLPQLLNPDPDLR
jgi:hypothetical protein